MKKENKREKKIYLERINWNALKDIDFHLNLYVFREYLYFYCIVGCFKWTICRIPFEVIRF